jgi:hypothetical protein
VQDEPRFTEEQFALVLRKALELQDRPGAAGRRHGGLTLAEMQAIAGEVGVDPELVARAATLVPHARGRTVAERILGGSTRAHLEYRCTATLAAEEMGSVVDRVRRVLDHQGKVTQVLDGVTWETVGEPSQLYVTLRPLEKGTDVQIRADRGAAFIMTWFLTLTFFLILAGATGGAVDPQSILEGMMLFGTFVAGALGTSRMIWARNSRIFEAKLQALLEAVSHEMEEAAERPPTNDTVRRDEEGILGHGGSGPESEGEP